MTTIASLGMPLNWLQLSTDERTPVNDAESCTPVAEYVFVALAPVSLYDVASPKFVGSLPGVAESGVGVGGGSATGVGVGSATGVGVGSATGVGVGAATGVGVGATTPYS